VPWSVPPPHTPNPNRLHINHAIQHTPLKVELSEFFNGKDHNGDGEPDFGFCFTPQPNYFYAFLAPILQADGYGCSLQASEGSAQDCQNMFFDLDTMEPLVDNPGFQYAVALHRRFMRSSNCHVGTVCGFDRNFHSRSAIEFHACDPREALPHACDQWHSSRVFPPVGTVNCVQTLKASMATQTATLTLTLTINPVQTLKVTTAAWSGIATERRRFRPADALVCSCCAFLTSAAFVLKVHPY
jgi:hypothetical protein